MCLIVLVLRTFTHLTISRISRMTGTEVRAFSVGAVRVIMACMRKMAVI